MCSRVCCLGVWWLVCIGGSGLGLFCIGWLGGWLLVCLFVRCSMWVGWCSIGFGIVG